MNRTNTNQTWKMPAAGVLQNISPKMMVMGVLVAVMAILWGRVLLRGKGGPAAVNAQETAALQQTVQARPVAGSVRISVVELPCRPGRNDILSKDMFSGADWTAFKPDQASEKNGLVAAADGSVGTSEQLKLEQIAARITLDAVSKRADGMTSQAFANGKILTVGSTLTVKEGPDQYALTVTDISENTVTFSWNTVSVVLKMAEINNE